MKACGFSACLHQYIGERFLSESGFHCHERFRNSVGVLAAGLGESGLTAATAFDVLGCLADYLRCVQSVVLDQVFGNHHGQKRFASDIDGRREEYRVLGRCGAYGERNSFDKVRNSDSRKAGDLYSVYFLGVGEKLRGDIVYPLLEIFIDFFMKVGVFGDGAAKG